MSERATRESGLVGSNEGDREQLDGEAAPSPRNPFAGEEAGVDDERPALITTKRSAAFWGVVAGLVLLLLVTCICIAGSIAFAG